MQEKFKKFTKPLSFEEIEWRIGSKIKENDKRTIKKTMVLGYIDARTATTRLDECFGPTGWKTEPIQDVNGGYIGGLSIKDVDSWISKWDGTGVNDENTVKSAVSDILKRCCVQWGLGKELYELPKFYIPGDVFYIEQDHLNWIEGILSKDKAHWPKTVEYTKDRELTLEEAKKIKWPCGKQKGMPLQEVMEKHQSSITWIQTKTTYDKFTTVKKAIEVLSKSKPIQDPMTKVQREQIIQFLNRYENPAWIKRKLRNEKPGVLDEILNLELSKNKADEVLKLITSKKFLEGE